MKKIIFFENSLKGRGTHVQIRFFLMLPILALGGGGILDGESLHPLMVSSSGRCATAVASQRIIETDVQNVCLITFYP